MKITKAVIPAAGFGTRFLPGTKAIPKEMFPIINVPTLQYIVEEAVESGITDIMIILGKNKKVIEDHFDISVELEEVLRKAKKFEEIEKMRKLTQMVNIVYVRQPEMNGSGGAIALSETFVGKDAFAVLFGDDLMYTDKGKEPVLKQLISAFQKYNRTVVGVQNVKREDAPKYGLIIPGKIEGRATEMLGFKEKPSIDQIPSTLASMGRYVFTNQIFDEIKKAKVNVNGEIYITDAIDALIHKQGVIAYDFEGTRYDIGDHFGFLQANIEYGLRNEQLRDKILEYIKGLVK